MRNDTLSSTSCAPNRLLTWIKSIMKREVLPDIPGFENRHHRILQFFQFIGNCCPQKSTKSWN
jgi:hypothetical protein